MCTSSCAKCRSQGRKNPDTALRIKEVEQNIWRHTISSAAALAVWPLKPNLSCVLAAAKSEREARQGGAGVGCLWSFG